MNELQLLRTELAAQRGRAREMALLCASQSKSYDIYLTFIIESESRRLASHLERLKPRSDLTPAERALLESSARELRTLDAIARDALALKAKSTVRLITVVEELEAIAVSRYGLEAWRRTAHLDADSILEERRLRKMVLEQTHGRTAG